MFWGGDLYFEVGFLRVIFERVNLKIEIFERAVLFLKNNDIHKFHYAFCVLFFYITNRVYKIQINN